MTWTYTDDPAGEPRDALRLAVGDTDTDDQQLTDAEVEFYIDQDDNANLAAALAADALAARYSRASVQATGDSSQQLYNRSQAYYRLAKQLRSRDDFVGATAASSPVYVSTSSDPRFSTEENRPWV
jgi:hypothetical protein